MIESKKAEYPVTMMCRLLGVSRSGYYAWRARVRTKRSRDNAGWVSVIRKAHRASGGTYGSPRIYEALRHSPEAPGRHRIARLMRQHGIVGRPKRRYRQTTDSTHDDPIAPNLLGRCFDVKRPNRIWVGDITYIATGEGWLYLAVLLDLYSRRVVGWSMGDDLATELALRALRMALGRREIAPGLIHHTDRGCQYSSGDYQDALARSGLVCSMSRKGDCWDNAVAESFFGTLKTELVHRSAWSSRAEARADLYAYLEGFYNLRRLHSTLGYRSPADFEAEEQKPVETAASTENAPRLPQPLGKRPSTFPTVPTGSAATDEFETESGITT